jgi:hypothetical protein
MPDICPCSNLGDKEEAPASGQRRFDRMVRPATWDLALHESAHASVAIALGIPVEAIKCHGTRCEVAVADWPPWSTVRERLLFRLAGRVRDGQMASRSPDDLVACLNKLRAGRQGICDWCWSFSLLLRDEPNASDRQLVEQLQFYERQVQDLMREPKVFDAILRVAKAFYIFGDMDGDDVRELCASVGLHFWPGPSR